LILSAAVCAAIPILDVPRESESRQVKLTAATKRDRTASIFVRPERRHVRIRIGYETDGRIQRWAFCDTTGQVLRGGQAREYVVAEEREDGSLLLAPEPLSSAQDTVPAEDGRAAAVVAVREVAGILQVSDLTVAYDRKTAVDAVGLEIRQGETFGLLGPNGAGKTSTPSAIEGLVKPQSGTILLDGIDSRRHPNQARARWACSFRRPAFSPS
jgi:ABC-type glutathione transport system ATPase component